MNSGDFVYIDYIGRIKDTREIFDLSKEDIAKKEGIFNPDFKYGPVPVIVDSELLIKGLNEALKEMKMGEKKTVEISPEKAFGERNEELVKLIPLSKFEEQNINATPGTFVTINGIRGRIISISGGRVKVDFNHPLAGKTLEYEVEILNKIKEIDEKVKAVVCYFTRMEKDDVEVHIKENESEIIFKKKFDMLIRSKELIAKTITKWIKEIKKVKFADIFE